VRVLIVGGGAREHALAWKLHRSPQVTAVYAAPGNAGISLLAHTIPTPVDDLAGLVEIARGNAIDLTVVGPEGPLAAGIVDIFQDAGLAIFGPTRAAARIESSKVWAKELMARHGIPVGRWAHVAGAEEARRQVHEFGLPVVLKADGLAAGKGAVVCRTIQEADETIEDFLVRHIHGASGSNVVVEEFLGGTELSVFALCDGQHVLPLIGARDYKPVADGDLGPNTGGMGGYAPPRYATSVLMERITYEILEPTVAAMAAEGAPYAGVLYAGLMLTRDGPRVLEFNCRWGDPEGELILPLLRTDLVDLMQACINGRLQHAKVEWNEGASCGVVLAARGYPTAHANGEKITGLDDLEDGVMAFHGGTRLLQSTSQPGGWLRRSLQGPVVQETGIVADGGRILTVVATGATVAEARARAYANVERIKFDGMQYRTDLGAVDPSLEEIWPGMASTAEPADRTGESESAVPAQPAGERASLTGANLTPSDAAQTRPAPGQATAAAPEAGPVVAILMGSESDRPIMDETAKALDTLGVPSETHVMSAHRTPERVRQFAKGAEGRGIRVIIAGAGGAAHLPGVISAQTTLPVIGVPIAGSNMMGLDSLLSIVQMPGGVPVATVAVGNAGARNAAYLAAAIIGLTDSDVRARYKRFRREQSGGELE
jgi:phosphoribosylamine--glycine ligase